MTLPRVAITQRLVQDKDTGEIRDALDIRWAELFQVLGWTLLPVPSGIHIADYLQAFPVEGVILSGGNNLGIVDPQDTLAQRRDAFERTVLGWSLQNNIPVLGICRGMQFLAQYWGGTIHAVTGHTRSTHGLRVTQDASYAAELNALGPVNSYHDYAVKTLPDQFILLAQADDNNIEAIQHRYLPLLGLMWHPERMDPLPEAQLAMLKRWLHAR